MSNNFLFSVVTAAYNVELYLAEAIDSIIKQDIGFKKNIQLILVDDGSTDGTGKICDEYRARYPENIVVIHKQNGGVSSARNAGMEAATGKYINFLDADDKFSPESFGNVYKFFEQHYDETDIVTVPIYYFEGRKGGHYLNDKFSAGNRIADITKDNDVIVKFVNASFFKNSAVKHVVRFDEELSISEDLKFCNEVIFAKKCCGFFKDAKYYYRIRKSSASSAIQTSKNNFGYYFPCLEKCYSWLIDKSKSCFGEIPLSVQKMIISELYWRVKNKETKPDFFSDEEWYEYGNKIKEFCKCFSDKAILECDFLNVDFKTFFMFHKYGKYPNIFYNKSIKEIYLTFHGSDKGYTRLSKQYTCIEFAKINGNLLHLEGFVRSVGISDDTDIKICVYANKRKYTANLVNRNTNNRERFGYPLYRDTGFVVDVPLLNRNNEIQIGYIVKNIETRKVNLFFGKFFPVSRRYKNSYYYSNYWILKANTQKGVLVVSKANLNTRIRHEICMVMELFKCKKYKTILARIYCNLMKIIKKLWKKELWLISDREDKADDNGEAFFRYLCSNQKKRVKPVFFIDKKSKDYKRLRKIGKVIPVNSIKYILNYLKCDMIVSSSADEYITKSVRGDGVKDLVVDKKQVFLQHGVITNDLSGWVNKYNKNLYKFVATTKPEYRSLLNYNYYYSDRNVILTGLPRHDLLYDDAERYVAVVPTWRKYLMAGVINDIWQPMSNFQSTDFFNFYNSLLNDARLLEVLREHNYKLLFVSHPIMRCYNDLYNKNDCVVISDGQMLYRDIFAKSSLLLTDYSSVAFDFVYLRKPIIYCQFDSNTFFKGTHSYDRGYFDYEKDGFGEVCTDLDSTVKTIIGYIENDCKLKNEYAERIENTFPFNDKCNCERVFKAIYES